VEEDSVAGRRQVGERPRIGVADEQPLLCSLGVSKVDTVGDLHPRQATRQPTYAPTMPSRPLSPDRQAITRLHTRVDVEAILPSISARPTAEPRWAGWPRWSRRRASTWSTR